MNQTELDRQEFLTATFDRNYWRQRWEGDHFVYATTQAEWEIWQIACHHLREQQRIEI